MKDSGTMSGGSLQSQYVSACEIFSTLPAVSILIDWPRSNVPLESCPRFSKQGHQCLWHFHPGTYPSVASPFLRHRPQNEPENSNPTYPSCLMTPAVMAQIGTSLRSLLNNNGLSGVKVYGFEVRLH